MTDKPLIMVVEDHRDVQEMLVDLFQLAQMDALGAGRGDEALALMRENPPDLAILDIDLPGEMSGLDLLRAIRDDQTLAPMPVVMLTAQNVAARTPDTDAADLVLLKPVDPDHLLRLVRRLLGPSG